MSFTEQEESVLKALAAGVIAAMGGRSGPTAQAGGDVATEYEMTGRYGDPVVRRDPRRWAGRSYAGCTYSQTEPAFLDELASSLDYKAGQEEAENRTYIPKQGKNKGTPQPVAPLTRKDARLARGWAAKLRGGYKPAAAAPMPDPVGNDPATAPYDPPVDDFSTEEIPF